MRGVGFRRLGSERRVPGFLSGAVFSVALFTVLLSAAVQTGASANRLLKDRFKEPLANARALVTAAKSTYPIRAATVRERFPAVFQQPPKDELQLVRRAHYLMGTLFEISAYGSDAERTAEAIEKAFAVIRRADEIMSDYREESDLTRLNRHGAQAWIPVPPELYDLLQESVRYSRLTGGAFDVTVSPLVSAWRQAAEQDRPLADSKRLRLLGLVGGFHLLWEEDGRSVRFDRSGVKVDLGGIAKGWAVDQAAAVLRQQGIERGLLSAGTSTIYALGAPPGQPAWSIGIRHPQREDDLLAVVSLKEASLSTSASYEKSWQIHGRTYSHVLDPRTGMPVERTLSCTVIAPTATASDAFSTAGFVLGLEQAENLFRQLGLPAVVAGVSSKDSGIVVRQVSSSRGNAHIRLWPGREGKL